MRGLLACGLLPLLLLQPTAASWTAAVDKSIRAAVFNSPIYRQLVVPQARATMVRTAEANGIRWSEALAWVKGAASWDDAELARYFLEEEVPAYYRAPFHAYDLGNLCWEAAWEQELAGKAVGARNMPASEDGEEAFRACFDAALASLGASCPATGAIVDMGCGTGTSTRRLARNFPRAASVLGLDISPHMIAVGTRLLELAPSAASATSASTAAEGTWVSTIDPDPRVCLACAEISKASLAPACADVVSLSLVLHELPPAAAAAVFSEAARLLKPGGQLWISEMDFETEHFKALKSNPLLYSLIRSTEPYLDDYAEYHPTQMPADLFEAGFSTVRLAAATGRHFALVATKRADGDFGEPMLDDRRRETAKADTHLQTWEIASDKGRA
ncbi:S-adenosyl-L-methionine-dependent methyltransferase [Pavlovales sp. CCMP2436]|nr:S-adenosyl-L-methionine-dependent methyltransferase [Pavlovales sp. CCMP2436]